MNLKRVFIFLLLLGLTFCKNLQNERNKRELIREIEQNKNELLNSIVDKSLYSISDIIINKNKGLYTVILYYSGYDCTSCVKKGFILLQEIDKKFSGNTMAISTEAHISRDQITYKYSKSIYFDKKESIRKELGAIPTPIIFIINNKYKIKKACFPHFHQGIEGQKKFKNYVISLSPL